MILATFGQSSSSEWHRFHVNISDIFLADQYRHQASIMSPGKPISTASPDLDGRAHVVIDQMGVPNSIGRVDGFDSDLCR